MVEPRILNLPLRLARWALRPLRPLVPWGSPERPGRPPRRPRDLDEETIRVQLGVAREALGGSKGIGVHDDEDPRQAYLYRPGEVLVPPEQVGRLTGFFAERQRDYIGTGGPREGSLGGLGVVRFALPQRRDGLDVPAVLDDLERELGEDVARPDHVVYVTTRGIGKMCPATEPQVPLNPQPLPPVSTDAGAGKGIRVSVVDTGWWEEAETTTPWLDDVEGDLETVNPAAIHPYAGHGTFVAGVVRCLAPATEIEVEGIMPMGGVAYESDIARELNEAMNDKDDPELISISAGTYTRRNRGMLAFEALAAAHDLIEGERAPLVIAAAGNDASTRPFYPAAYPWVVGVGALDDDGGVCDFSNTGEWVDVYAHGRDLVNAFPIGTYTCHEPLHDGEVRSFKGLAQWSGTSFATPVVTGTVAAHMAATGTSARKARDELVAGGQPFNDPRAGRIVALGPPFV